MTHTKNHRKRKNYHIAPKDRAYLVNNLALLLRANVPIGEAIESLALTASTRRFRNALKHMQADIDEGIPLWDSLQGTGMVSNQSLVLIKLGEASGRLVESMQKAAEQEDRQRLFKSKIRSAMLYPSIVIGMTAVAGLGIAWFLLPKLSVTFKQMDAHLPLISRVMLEAGEYLRENGVWLLPVVIGSVLALGMAFSSVPVLRRSFQRLQLHIPGIGGLLKELEVARFGYLLGTLLNSGLPVTEATKLLEQATTSPQYKKLYHHLSSELDEGYSFKAALATHKHANKLLPPAVQQMLMAGERSGSLPETLLSIGKQYEEKSDITTKNLEIVMEPALLLIIGSVVLVVMLAVLMPIYGLVNQIQG